MLAVAAGEAAGEDTEAFVAARIAALNRTPTALKPDAYSLSVEIELPEGQKKRATDIRAGLAKQGVSIRVVNGRYVNVTDEVQNGHVLEPEEKWRIASMNYHQEEICRETASGLIQSGESPAWVSANREYLKSRGIILKQKSDLFVVDSVFKRKGDVLTTGPRWK